MYMYKKIINMNIMVQEMYKTTDINIIEKNSMLIDNIIQTLRKFEIFNLIGTCMLIDVKAINFCLYMIGI